MVWQGVVRVDKLLNVSRPNIMRHMLVGQFCYRPGYPHPRMPREVCRVLEFPLCSPFDLFAPKNRLVHNDSGA